MKTRVGFCKRAAAFAGPAVLSTFGAAILAPPAVASTTFSAIAVSPSTHVVGWSMGYPAETGSGPNAAGAVRAADECANHPLHPTDCRWLVSGPCVAIFVSAERYLAKYGETRAEAKSKAEIPDWTGMNSVCSNSGSQPDGGALLSGEGGPN